MSRTVLITGAGGFIWSAVTRLFVQAVEDEPPKFSDGTPVGHIVALLRPGGSPERLAELPKSAAWSVEHADMTDRQALRDLLRRARPRAILHLALDRAAHSDLAESPAPRISSSPLGTLFEGLAGVPGARFIHTGSAWVLRPGDRLDETAPVEPRFAYARYKALEEDLLPVLGARTGVSWINLRLFNTFGKYERASRLLPYLVSRLTHRRVAELSQGNQIRDFNDVESVAQAYPAALRADDGASGGAYHI